MAAAPAGPALGVCHPETAGPAWVCSRPRPVTLSGVMSSIRLSCWVLCVPVYPETHRSKHHTWMTGIFHLSMLEDSAGPRPSSGPRDTPRSHHIHVPPHPRPWHIWLRFTIWWGQLFYNRPRELEGPQRNPGGFQTGPREALVGQGSDPGLFRGEGGTGRTEKAELRVLSIGPLCEIFSLGRGASFAKNKMKPPVKGQKPPT